MLRHSLVVESQRVRQHVRVGVRVSVRVIRSVALSHKLASGVVGHAVIKLHPVGTACCHAHAHSAWWRVYTGRVAITSCVLSARRPANVLPVDARVAAGFTWARVPLATY
jgi:hypothetical protein